MAKKKIAVSESTPITAGTSGQKVWQIARFSDRYEYREDKEKSGSLGYTKDYVAASGRDPEARLFMDQLDELREVDNYKTHEWAFNELKRYAANDVYGFRGQLLFKRLPASIKRMAGWLDCSEDECQTTLDILANVGLIELVDWPMVATVPAPAKQPNQPSPADSREKLQNSAENPAKRKTGNGKGIKVKETGNPPAAAGGGIPAEINQHPHKISPNGQDAAGNKDKPNEPETRNPKANQTAGQQSGTEGSTQERLKPDNPIYPTISDAPVGESLQQGSNPQGSITDKFFDELKEIKGKSITDFAIEIFYAIFKRYPLMPDDIDQPKAIADKSEVRSFESAWEIACNAKLTPQMYIALWHRSIKEASALGTLFMCQRKGRKKIKNPRAVWWSVFEKLLDTARVGNLNAESKHPPSG